MNKLFRLLLKSNAPLRYLSYIIIATLAVITWANRQWLGGNFLNFVSWLGTCIAVWQIVERKWPPFYVFWCQVRAAFLGAPTRFEASAVIEGMFDETVIMKLKESLAKWGKSSSLRVVKESNSSFHVIVEGMTVLVDYYEKYNENESEDVGHVSVLVPDYNASFPYASDVIQTRILPLFRDLERAAQRPVSSLFNFSVVFEKGNPFLGFYAQHLPQGELQSFEARVSMPSSTNEKSNLVTITQNRIVIATSDFITLLHGAEKYIALGGVMN